MNETLEACLKKCIALNRCGRDVAKVNLVTDEALIGSAEFLELKRLGYVNSRRSRGFPVLVLLDACRPFCKSLGLQLAWD
jgi:hypothetical protein